MAAAQSRSTQSSSSSHDDTVIQPSKLTVISYNMHGYNQCAENVRDLIRTLHPDVIALQEHWLTPANLVKLDQLSQLMIILFLLLRLCLNVLFMVHSLVGPSGVLEF